MSTAPDDRFAALQEAVAGIWSIEREIGRGGMATVYLARDVALDRPVALKLLDEALTTDPASRERFLREARTGARLAHPNIVPIYDVIETDQVVCFVMAFVDGETMGAKLRREGPLTPDDATRILREIGWALAAAHAAGVLHRDVTVDNILIEQRTGRALLADFGIAAPRDGGDAGPLIGTPAYLAPELIHGDPPSPASDLYALGIVGWTMLAGRLPFLDQEIAELLVRQVSEPIPSLERAAPGTPRRLVRAIESLVAKDPAARPGSVEDWLATVDATPVRTTLASPLARWITVRQHLQPMYALAITTIGMLGAAMVFLAMGTRMTGLPVALTVGPKLLLAVGGVTAIVQLSVAFRAARRAGRAGYRIEDLRLALDRTESERTAAGPISPTIAGRVIRSLANLAGLALAGVMLMVLTGGPPSFLSFTARLWLWRWLLFLLPATWAALWTLRGIGVVVPGRRLMPTDRRWRLRRAVWRSHLGAWWFRIATIGLGREIAAASTLHRPTEMVLGLQIADLWRALPASSRHGIGDLPATAEALHRRLDDVRRLLAALDHDHAASPEVIQLRDRLLAQRDAAIDALEQLRILLLQLGGESAPDGELTRRLHDAREVETALLEELGAHRGVRRLLGRRSPTPAPTPA